MMPCSTAVLRSKGRTLFLIDPKSESYSERPLTNALQSQGLSSDIHPRIVVHWEFQAEFEVAIRHESDANTNVETRSGIFRLVAQVINSLLPHGITQCDTLIRNIDGDNYAR
jgi:hypothetical protein